MNRSGMKCVLYPRVSTEMQIDGFSLDGQRTSLNRFANREEMIVVDIYEDAGKSGKSIEGRPASSTTILWLPYSSFISRRERFVMYPL